MHHRRMRTGRALVLVVLMAVIAMSHGRVHQAQAAGNSLYVATSGSDGSSGATPDTALATLQAALKKARPGTTIRVLPGVYEQTARRVLKGAPGARIAIVGEGGRPVFSGGRKLRWGLWLDESEQVTVEGIEFRDYTDIGILVVGSSDITLRRLRVRNNGFKPQIGWVEGYGIHLDESSDLLVERNNVLRNGPNPRPWNEAGTGINGFGMRRAVIRRNRSHGNHGGGILVEDSIDVLVKANRIYGNDLDVSADQWWDGGIWLDGGRDVTLVRNRLWNNLGPGIEISDEDCQNPTGYVVRNNSSTGNYFGIFIWNFGSKQFPPARVLRRSGNDWSGSSRQDVWIQAWRLKCRR